MSQFRSVCGLILAAGMLTAGVCDSSSSDPAPAPVPGVIPSEFRARFVAFESEATNLTADYTTTGRRHIYIKNLDSGGITRIDGGSAEPDHHSLFPRMSADGRFIAFESAASNIAGGQYSLYKILVHDLTAGTTDLVSVNNAGDEANANSLAADISPDGRYVAFLSIASNLGGGGAGTWDVFLRDRLLGTTEVVSVDSSEVPGNDHNGWTAIEHRPAVSADGRYVVFSSRATNLVGGDTNDKMDVFVRDRQLGTTEVVSVATGGALATGGGSFDPVISADGRYVVFRSNATNLGGSGIYIKIFLRDRLLGTTEHITRAIGEAAPDGASDDPALSADGRYVAFQSYATNLVAGPTIQGYKIFVRDRAAGTTERVGEGTQPNGHSFSPSISSDGGFVAFESFATNYGSGDPSPDEFDILLWDRELKSTRRVSIGLSGVEPGGDSFHSSVTSVLSPGDHRLAFSSQQALIAEDTNGAEDVYVHDVGTGSTRLMSVNSDGVQGDAGSNTPSISIDGRFVAFQSAATNLASGDTNAKVDVFVRDRLLGITERVSVSTSGAQGDDHSFFPAISGDGRYVAFSSYADNLGGGASASTQVYVRDRYAGTTTLISVNTTAGPGNGHSSESTDVVASISADGRFVAFASLATDLVAGDTNGFRDVFVRDRTLGTTVRASVNTDGTQADNDSLGPAISGDGWTVAFHSRALTLVTPNDLDTMGDDVFVRDLAAGTTVKISAKPDGTESTGQAYYPSLSYDGRYVAFESSGSDLGPADGNLGADIYMYDRWTMTMEIASVSSDEVQANDLSMWAQISADGRYVAFWSNASNLVAGAPIGSYYLRDRDLGTTVGLPAGAQDPAFPNQ